MDNSESHAAPSDNIPVLFDIVERGKNAPEEDKIKPPPPAEVTEFRLDESKSGSEDPTVLSGSENPDSEVFTLDELEAITQESATVPASMLNDTQPSRDELVAKLMRVLVPHLEELVRETLEKTLNASQDNQPPEQQK